MAASVKQKVGVVTIVDYTNYGNRLQNYAVQEILRGLGHDPVTIRNFPITVTEPRHPWQDVPDAPPVPPQPLADADKGLKGLARRLRRRYAPTGKERARKKEFADKAGRAARLVAFSRAHIRETDFTMFRDAPAERLDAAFDRLVVGSDQVWNPMMRKHFDLDFLTFARPEKRISFSASMGVSRIPEASESFYAERLAGFAHLSVREEAAAAEVRRLTGRDALVTLDPTQVLETEAWRRLARPHASRPKGRYLLTYFLGERTPAYRRLIEDVARRSGLEVVHLNDPEMRALYNADAAEFIGLIADAALFFTDSFHGVIFSVAFDTPFVSFPRVDERASMSSRLDTLLGTLGLGHRRYRDDLDAEAVGRMLEPDYADAHAVIAAKRLEALAFLDRALAG